MRRGLSDPQMKYHQPLNSTVNLEIPRRYSSCTRATLINSVWETTQQYMRPEIEFGCFLVLFAIFRSSEICHKTPLREAATNKSRKTDHTVTAKLNESHSVNSSYPSCYRQIVSQSNRITVAAFAAKNRCRRNWTGAGGIATGAGGIEHGTRSFRENGEKQGFRKNRKRDANL
jgi:hypothetical protein